MDEPAGVVNSNRTGSVRLAGDGNMASDGKRENGRFTWAGPALFASVAIAIAVFFWWLL